MKNNLFVQGKLALQKMLIPAGVYYVAYLAGLFIVEGGFDKHLNTILNAPDIFSSFGLLSQQLLKILGLIMFARAIYKLRVDIITVIFVLFLSVSSFVNLRIFTFYMDSMGDVTDFNLKSGMLLIGLTVL